MNYLVIVESQNDNQGVLTLLTFLVDEDTGETTTSILEAKRFPNIWGAEEASIHIKGSSVVEVSF